MTKAEEKVFKTVNTAGSNFTSVLAYAREFETNKPKIILSLFLDVWTNS